MSNAVAPKRRIILFPKDILGTVAMWAVRQSPYNVPDNLDVVLTKLAAIIDTVFTQKLGDSKYMEMDDYWKLQDFLKLHLESIPEFVTWNERKNGNQAPYGIVDVYHKRSPDNDFIDLDALYRNVGNSLVRESEFEKHRDALVTIHNMGISGNMTQAPSASLAGQALGLDDLTVTSKDKRALIMEALGEASMAWDTTPSGVFDEAAAIRIGEQLLTDLASPYHSVEPNTPDLSVPGAMTFPEGA